MGEIKKKFTITQKNTVKPKVRDKCKTIDFLKGEGKVQKSLVSLILVSV